MKVDIIQANEDHRHTINRLIRETKIGPQFRKGRLPWHTWVAKVGDKAVGFQVLVFWKNTVAILEGGAVNRELRHQGIGSLLMQRAVDEAKKKGATIVALATMYYWFRFCKKRGFRTCPRKNLPPIVASYPQFRHPRYMKCAVMVQFIKT